MNGVGRGSVGDSNTVDKWCDDVNDEDGDDDGLRV